MITGDQLRLIVARLAISTATLSRRTAIGLPILEKCLAATGPLTLTEVQEERLRAYLGRSGVLIFEEKRNDDGVRFMRGER